MSGVDSRAEAENPKGNKSVWVPVLTVYHRAENLHCWRLCSHNMGWLRTAHLPQGRPFAEGPCKWNLLESIFLLVLKEVIHGRESHCGNCWKISHRNNTLEGQPLGGLKEAAHGDMLCVFWLPRCRNLSRKTSEPEEKPLSLWWLPLVLLTNLDTVWMAKEKCWQDPSSVRTGQSNWEWTWRGNKLITDKTGFAKTI